MPKDLDTHANRRRRVTHPKGYEPGVELDEEGGSGVTFTEADDDIPPGLPDEEWLIARFGLDPDEWRIIDGTLQARQWQRWDGLWLHYFKAQLARRKPAERELLAELVKRTTRRPRIKGRKAGTVGGFVTVITDTQIGKGNEDGSGGTDNFLVRLADSVDAAVGRMEELRARGRWTLNEVAILAGGDLIEGTSGQYAAQPFRIDLGLRDQIEIAALSMDYAIDRFLNAGVDKVTAAFVPSNHGENRNGKQIATEERDSTDLVVADQLRRAYAKSPNADRVDIVVPWANNTTLALDIAGTKVGLTHGHTTGRRSLADWWAGQMVDSSRPTADARILVAGHRHHLRIEDVADGRYLMQWPAMEAGSVYWTEMTGTATPPGLGTFVVHDGRPHDVELIRLT